MSSSLELVTALSDAGARQMLSAIASFGASDTLEQMVPSIAASAAQMFNAESACVRVWLEGDPSPLLDVRRGPNVDAPASASDEVLVLETLPGYSASLTVVFAAGAERDPVAEALFMAMASAGLTRALRHERERVHNEWMLAGAEVVGMLMSAQPVADTLKFICERAVLHSGAARCFVVLESAGQFHVEAGAGEGFELLMDKDFELDGTIAGQVMDSATAMVVDGFVPLSMLLELGLTPTTTRLIPLGPLAGEARPVGLLAVAFENGRGSGLVDPAHLQTFATQAAFALMLEGQRARLADDLVHDERDRIARLLREQTIQELFAIGMQLQSTISLVQQPAIYERLVAIVAAVDAAIRGVRDNLLAPE